MTSGKNSGMASQAARRASADEIARSMKARFARAGAHPSAQALCQILIHYRLRQREDANA
ncbi:MAG: hypothetical protein LBD68_08490 [Zoogloeaceae bacterium]|jgi:hypothetical protein|nr:hypothetical protein [Zoogloeaceae bacterium]